MPDFITLTCPSCGGQLQITIDIERFACGHCGNEHIVRRSGGVVSLAPVIESLRQVQAGVDKTASEKAIVRLKEDIADLQAQLYMSKQHARVATRAAANRARLVAAGLAATFALLMLCVFGTLILMAFSTHTDLGIIVPVGIFVTLAPGALAIANWRGFNLSNRAMAKAQGEVRRIEELLEPKLVELKRHQEVVARY